MAVDTLLDQHTDIQLAGSGATWSLEDEESTLGRLRAELASTAATHSVTDAARFEELATQWHEDTKFSSDTGEITAHLSYRRIIGMGQDAVPWILHDLRVRGGDWFAALEAITGESPVAREDVGFPGRMKEAWFRWGKAQGYRF